MFAEGWTDEDSDHVLRDLEDTLGLQLRCVWEYRDEYGFGGHSELVAVIHHQAVTLPAGLWELLVDGTGDGVVDPGTTGDPDPEIDLQRLAAAQSASGHNLARDDRRPGRAHD
jgi:hypothetical protein